MYIAVPSLVDAMSIWPVLVTTCGPMDVVVECDYMTSTVEMGLNVEWVEGLSKVSSDCKFDVAATGS